MKKTCNVCKGLIPHGRHNGFCSKKCQAEVEGYSDAHVRTQEKLASELEGTTAWRPEPIEPIHHVISSKPIMIFSDIHAPLHSPKWIMQGMKCADRLESDTLIVNGDFIDANQISRHIGGYYRRRSELNDDFSAGESLLRVFASRFKKVIFLNGNHCGERLVKAFRGEVAMQRLWKMFGEHKNVKVCARSFIFVNDEVVVGHPRQYSRLRGGIAQKIAMHWQKHVVLGHGHHSAKAVTSDGKWQACDIPCMAELAQFEYTTFEINDMPKPLNGFGAVVGNKIQIFDHFTPWKLFNLPEMDEKK